jgi:hypothetical protein
VIKIPPSGLSTPRRAALAVAALLALAFCSLAPAPASAQPFGAWFVMSGAPQHGFIGIPHSAALNPTNRFTFEAWVAVTDPGGCSSIAGKSFTQAWWVGICGTTLRSYLKGTPSLKDGGVIPPGTWTHIAVVFNGTRRIHYVNGEQVLNVPETGPLTTSSSEMRIGSDFNFAKTPAGAIDEVRLWSIARSQAQIRQSINKTISAPQAGLVGVWALDGSGNDVVGTHDGTQQGVGVGFLTFPPGGSCTTAGSFACVGDRFLVSAKYRTGGPGTALTTAPVGPAVFNSAVFSFPDPETWQILVDVINACSSSGKFTFAASTPSTLFERIEVFDTHAFQNKVYFHYPGPPVAPIVDTSAFATCP